MKLVQKLAVVALFASTSALAQADAGTDMPPAPPAPTADEVRRVFDYYMNGAGPGGGPLLVDAKLCLKMDTVKSSPTVNTCIEPVTGPVKKGSVVSYWTQWMVPKGGKYEDVQIQILHEGQVRETKDVSALTENWRSRTWKGANLAKPGKWTFKLIRGGTELKSEDVTVQ